MIIPVSRALIAQCLNVLHESFKTVANEFALTEQNAPTNAAFLKIERLNYDFDSGAMMFCLTEEDKAIGFVELKRVDEHSFNMEKLAVLPKYRHLGYGKELIDFAKQTVTACGGDKITIGIIEENTRLKNWYTANGFIHTGTKALPHLPFIIGFMEWHVRQLKEE